MNRFAAMMVGTVLQFVCIVVLISNKSLNANANVLVPILKYIPLKVMERMKKMGLLLKRIVLALPKESVNEKQLSGFPKH